MNLADVRDQDRRIVSAVNRTDTNRASSHRRGGRGNRGSWPPGIIVSLQSSLSDADRFFISYAPSTRL